VHEYGLGITNGFSAKSFNSSTQSKVFTLDNLRVSFTGNMLFSWNIPLIATPVVSIICGNSKRLQQILECPKHFIFTSTKSKGYYHTGMMVNRKP
jgi:hypothetical protein